jgi:hypothetical protein
MNTKNQKEKTVKTTRTYGVGSFSLTLILMVIFGLIGAIVGGFSGLAVGIVMVLMASIISWSGLIPFAGVFLFVGFFNQFMDWLYTLAPNMGVLISPDALPRIVLFWIFGILAAVATVVFTILAVIIVLAGIVAILEYRN